MKRYVKVLSIVLIIFLVFTTFFTGCNNKNAEATTKGKTDILDMESRKSFDFFWNEANSSKNSPGYGLIRDRAPGNSDIASVASVGYGLTALTIGAERKWVPYDKAKERALGTLNTLLKNVPNVKGFFYHFVNMETAKREWNSEASIIDTAIALCGAIEAGEYFGGDVKKKADEIYRRVDWTWYRNPQTNQFYMGYSPEKGFFGAWDMAAEQFMMYFLGAGSPTHPVSGDMFYNFNRTATSYGFYPSFIQSPTGSIFTYQYSFAWFDMRNKVDKKGVNWWTNSILASKTSRQFSIDNSKYFKTFGENSWGITACDGPQGYSGGYGINSTSNDGTVAPSGAAGSIVFTPKESIDALNNYYDNHKQLWGKYGFYDAYNLDANPAWFDKDVIGIDKGITLLMIENYRSGLVWKYYMKNKYVQDGMKKAGVLNIEANGIPVAHSVIIDGMPPFVGQTLKAGYNYFSAEGASEGNSKYRWLIADSIDGNYEEIPGENKLTYIIKASDVGKYIKFEVTPKSKASLKSPVPKTGHPVVSSAVGEIMDKDPRLSIGGAGLTDQATKVTDVKDKISIGDLGDSKTSVDWFDGGDGAYSFNIANGDAENPNKALKIDYTKGNTEWAYFYTKFVDNKDFSAYTGIQAKVKGQVSFIMKFEDSSSQGVIEKNFTVNDTDRWNEIQWNFNGNQNKLKNIKRILIFAAPGEKSKSGEFFLNQIELYK